MKKLLSFSLILSLGLATVTPALNAAQSQTVAESQANPAHASGWQAAKKWWRSGRNMKALNRQEQRAFNALKKKFTLGAIITAIVAIVGGGAAYRYRRSAGGAANVSARPFSGDDGDDGGGGGGGPTVRPAPVVPGYLREELERAAYRGNKEVVENLLKRGADVNAAGQVGYTALMWAAYGGHENIIERLSQEGADVNAIDNAYLETALMKAARWGHEKTVKKLLDAGADKNIQNKFEKTAEDIARAHGYNVIANMISNYRPAAQASGLTAFAPAFRPAPVVPGYLGKELIDAVRGFDSDETEVKELIARGADVNARGRNRETALMQAARWGHEYIVKMLLDAGADKDMQDNDRRTAEDIARINNQNRIVYIIRDYGKDK